MSSVAQQPVTELLVKWQGGYKRALNALIPLLYDEFHHLASRLLRSERPEHTLQSTALVSEAYMRQAKHAPLPINDRAHSLGVAAYLMRQILVDYARASTAGPLARPGESRLGLRCAWLARELRDLH